jgi:hypothetical protein
LHSRATFRAISHPTSPGVARAVCLADLDRQFEFGLQAVLAGLEA